MSNTPEVSMSDGLPDVRWCDYCNRAVLKEPKHECKALTEIGALMAANANLATGAEQYAAEVERLQSEVQQLKEKRDAEVRQSNAHFEETERNLYLRINDLEERNEKLESALKEYARPMLFVGGEFTLHSGGSSNFKLECDALSDEEIAVIAKALRDILPPFGYVVGVPRGGLKLAEAMRRYITSGPLLIVDDVLTTGRSMEEMALKCAGTNPVIGAVIFARSKCSSWITPLFTMTSCQSVFGVGKENS